MTSEFFFSLPLQMKLGHIYYMHDSTESTEDSFTLSASAYEIERRSLPFTISVTVIPVNDEPPKLTRNTGLEVALFSLLLTCARSLVHAELLSGVRCTVDWRKLLLQENQECVFSFFSLLVILQL